MCHAPDAWPSGDSPRRVAQKPVAAPNPDLLSLRPEPEVLFEFVSPRGNKYRVVRLREDGTITAEQYRFGDWFFFDGCAVVGALYAAMRAQAVRE